MLLTSIIILFAVTEPTNFTKSPSLKSLFINFAKTIKTNGGIVVGIISFACITILSVSMTMFGSLLITDSFKDIDKGKEFLSNLNLISNLANLVLSFIFGFLMDKFKIWKLATIINVPALAILALFLIYFETRDTYFYIYYTALNCLAKVIFIIYSVLLSKNLNEKTRGSVLAVGGMVMMIPLIIFYKYGSYLFDEIGHTVPFFISLILYAISSLITLIMGLMGKIK